MTAKTIQSAAMKRMRLLGGGLRFSEPLLTALTILLALVLFVLVPLQAIGVAGVHHIAIVFGLILVGGVFIVSRSRVAVIAMSLAVALVLAATVLRLRQPSLFDVFLTALAWLIGAATLSVVVARAVFGPGETSLHRIIGAVLLYLLIGLIFAALYCTIEALAPHAFVGAGPIKDNLALAADWTYFSFVTLTSVGYGDIAPIHPIARSLANVEAIIGQLYPATLLARLVTLELNRRHRG
jgi:hypothetical protein